MIQIPAGLLDNTIEFFTDKLTKSVYLLQNGKTLSFDEFPENLKHYIWQTIKQDDKVLRGLMFLAGPDRDRLVRQYLLCLYGGLDDQPDMIGNSLQLSEYWACPKRGCCKFEGIICQRFKTESGEYLTKREIEVLQLIAYGYLDKEIADRLNISKNTVPMHTLNLRQKTGLHRKADLTRYAIQKHLI